MVSASWARTFFKDPSQGRKLSPPSYHYLKTAEKTAVISEMTMNTKQTVSMLAVVTVLALTSPAYAGHLGGGIGGGLGGGLGGGTGAMGGRMSGGLSGAGGLDQTARTPDAHTVNQTARGADSKTNSTSSEAASTVESKATTASRNVAGPAESKLSSAGGMTSAAGAADTMTGAAVQNSKPQKPAAAAPGTPSTGTAAQGAKPTTSLGVAGSANESVGEGSRTVSGSASGSIGTSSTN
jgi:hypothetical protein